MVDMLDEISNYWRERKFEAHPFKVKWYNDAVQPIFHLPYADDTVAIVVLSVPGMFDATFLPFIRKNTSKTIKDPIDTCMVHVFNKFLEAFSSHRMDVLHDFELNTKRKARVLVQTAGHVSGAAYFYQKSAVNDDPWGEKRIFGVSLHPKFGGWFGFRGVVVLKDVICPDLRFSEPVDLLRSREQKIEVLEKFNFRWRDSSYRDVIDVDERYSEREKLYFDTLPKERWRLVDEWRLET